MKLFLAHINEGHRLISQGSGGERERMYLFTSTVGRPFTDVTFVHYWKGIMLHFSPDQKYFPPGLLRTMFIEEFTRSVELNAQSGVDGKGPACLPCMLQMVINFLLASSCVSQGQWIVPGPLGWLCRDHGQQPGSVSVHLSLYHASILKL